MSRSNYIDVRVPYYNEPINSIINRVNSSREAVPILTISSWSMVASMPDAMLTIRERPRVRIPAWAATIASGTVLIPTASAPSRYMALISAGVSNWGPVQTHKNNPK